MTTRGPGPTQLARAHARTTQPHEQEHHVNRAAAFVLGLIVVMTAIPLTIAATNQDQATGTITELAVPATTDTHLIDDQPDRLSTRDAGRAYLAAVRPANRTNTALNDNEVGVTTMDSWRAEGRAARTAQRAFLDMLNTTAWPTRVQPHAEQLALCVGTQLRYFDAIASATTYDELPYSGDFECSTETAGQSQIMRSLLGITSATT